MTKTALAPDATIRDILATLSDPEAFVRGVFHNLHEWRREKGEASVWIGVTGAGRIPYYRVECSTTEFGPDTDMTEYFRAFSGRTHKRLDWGQDEVREANWSRSSMDYEEVRVLLGEIRGFQGVRSAAKS